MTDFNDIAPPKKKGKVRGKGRKKQAIYDANHKKKKALEARNVDRREQTLARKQKELDQLKRFLEVEEDGGGVVEVALVGEQLDSISERFLDDENVLWKPFEGPQTEFLQSTETEVLFSGGRSSGKSQALLIDPTRYVHNENFRGLILRKNMKHFRNLIRHSKKLYLKGIPGTTWKEMDKMFVFPSGATLEFGYCEREDDIEQYIGQEYTWLGIDEITQYEGDWIIELIKPSLRSGDPTLPIQIRASTNPTGPGRTWVKERFNILFGDAGNAGVHQEKIIPIKTKTGEAKNIITSYKWIHSTINDNPVMSADEQYQATLAGIKNENLRRQWLDGDWDSADGLAFSEFRRETHVCKPFAIPRGWRKFRACDWGFSAKPYAAAMLWFAVDPEGRIVVYREYSTRQMLVRDFALTCRELERGEGVQYGTLDCSAWSNRGEMGESPADTMMALGLRMMQSDKSNGSRARDKLTVHQYLSNNPDTNKPRLVIFDTCKNLIEELLNLPLDSNNNEDVDTKAVDHFYDCLRYGLQSRPLNFNVSVFGSYNDNTSYNDRLPMVDSTFGY